MRKLLFVLMLFLFGIASAQGTQTVAVKVSSQTQQINGKDYYVHVVEQGQTVFSIARAYGLKYYDAVIKSDIHLLKVGDTVWLPKNENSVAAVSAKASAATDPNGVRYIRIEAGQTLYSIAREYGLSVEQIVEANPSLRNDVLKAGQMIKIPAGIRPSRDVTELVAQDEQRQVEQQAAEAKAAEEKRLAEQRAAEEKRLAEQRAAEEKRLAEQRAAEEKRLAEQRAAEEKRLAEQRAAEEKRLAEQRAAEAKAAEEKRLEELRAEEKRLSEQRAAEEKRIAELKAEGDRVAKQRAEEEKRLADLKKEEEHLRKQQAAEEKRLEEQRVAEEKRLAEQKAAENKAAEEKRLAEQKAAENKAAEEKRLAEQKAAENKVAEEKRLAEQQSNTTSATSSSDINSIAVQRKVVNPYPFSEVPNDFPLQQAPYFNFSTVSSYNYQVRDLQSKDRVCVSVVMPLNLDKINEISTSKFDIEQRGKKEYKVFEFIQFYEGILIALDELQQQGYNVVVNVVDLSSENDVDVVEAFYSHNVANSDFIIALLVKKPFAKLAELAKKHQVFVINPFSSRADVVKDNPYVVKYMASIEGTVKGMLDIMASRYRNGHLYVVHSNNKNTNSEEKLFLDEFQRQLTGRKDITYTIFDWAANAKLLSTLKTTNDNVIISLYDQDKNKNTVYTSTLLNRLASQNTHVPVLMTTDNILTTYQNVDFDQLQHLNYTTVTLGHLDYDNAKHKAFIDTYKHKFHTEPNTLYAGVAHDIMLYFVSALSQQGAEFWRNPQEFKSPAGMLFPFNLRQSSSIGGYENQSPDIYQMVNYKLLPLSTH